MKLDVAPGDPTAGGGDGSCTCLSADDRIYVLSYQGEIWAFFPLTNTFEKLGAPGCVPSGAFSMGIDRSGYAWIMEYGSADLFKVSLADPNECEDPGYVPEQTGFGVSGMGFVSNGVTDACDKLYLHDANPGDVGGKLGVLDPDNLAVTTVGKTDLGLTALVELTGTGDGRLYGIVMGDYGVSIVQFDKSNAMVLETTPTPDIPLTGVFAFAFFGGDFYVFTPAGLPNFDTTTSVSSVSKIDFDESDGPGKTVTVPVMEAPILIVGAGVSTCVPFTPPG